MKDGDIIKIEEYTLMAKRAKSCLCSECDLNPWDSNLTTQQHVLNAWLCKRVDSRCGNVTDRDGKFYRMIVVGKDGAENLASEVNK
jgi:hypothetical protein